MQVITIEHGGVSLDAGKHDGRTAEVGRHSFTAQAGQWRLEGRWPMGSTLRVSGALHREIRLSTAAA